MAATQVINELYLPAQEPHWEQLQIFDTTLTVAEANGTSQGGCQIVSGCGGRSFVPVEVWWKCTGSASNATLLEIVDNDGNVVCSHVRADCTDGTWVGTSGGTVVTTKLRVPTAVGKGLVFKPTGADIQTTTFIRVIVMGFYV